VPRDALKVRVSMPGNVTEWRRIASKGRCANLFALWTRSGGQPVQRQVIAVSSSIRSDPNTSCLFRRFPPNTRLNESIGATSPVILTHKLGMSMNIRL
jgi:hypothetical protein